MDTQKQIDAAPPEGADNGEKIFCGKFASVGELERAYDSLQSEFTRRCQLNALLKRRLEESAAKSSDGDGKHAEQEAEKEPSTATASGGVNAPPSECGEGEKRGAAVLDEQTRRRSSSNFCKTFAAQSRRRRSRRAARSTPFRLKDQRALPRREGSSKACSKMEDFKQWLHSKQRKRP